MKQREYHTFVGWHEGHQLVFGSHGVGAGGASCYFEELIQAGMIASWPCVQLIIVGVTTIIRAGTAGSFTPKIREVLLLW